MTTNYVGGLGAPVTLKALSLSSVSATALVAWQATVGALTPGSTLTATSSDGTALTVSGATVSGTFAAQGNPTISLTETLIGATNSPNTTTEQISVVAALQTLTLSANTFAVGATAGTVIGNIVGKSAGSTLTISPNDGRVAFNGAQSQLLVGLTAASAGTIAYTITETLAGAAGSPKVSPISITVSAAPIYTSASNRAYLPVDLIAATTGGYWFGRQAHYPVTPYNTLAPEFWNGTVNYAVGVATGQELPCSNILSLQMEVVVGSATSGLADNTVNPVSATTYRCTFFNAFNLVNGFLFKPNGVQVQASDIAALPATPSLSGDGHTWTNFPAGWYIVADDIALGQTYSAGAPYYTQTHLQIPTSATINSATLVSGTTYSFGTSSAHGLTNGDYIVISGSAVAGYNTPTGVQVQATVTSSTSFTLNVGSNPAAFTGTALARPTIPSAALNPLPARYFTSLSGNGTIATAVVWTGSTNSKAPLNTGDVIQVSNVGTSAFNGSVTITVTAQTATSTTFTYPCTSNSTPTITDATFVRTSTAETEPFLGDLCRNNSSDAYVGTSNWSGVGVAFSVPASHTFAPGPCAVRSKYISGKRCVNLAGDSIAQRQFDGQQIASASSWLTGTFHGTQGMYERSLEAAGYPTVKTACYGTSASTGLNYGDYKIRGLAASLHNPLASFTEMGTNDVGANPTYSQLVSYMQNHWSNLRAWVNGPVCQGTLIPKSTSTDSFVTKANQTVTTQWAYSTPGGSPVGYVVANFNPAVIAGSISGGPNSYIDAFSLISALDANLVDGKWPVTGSANGYTADGTHPNYIVTPLIPGVHGGSQCFHAVRVVKGRGPSIRLALISSASAGSLTSARRDFGRPN